MSCRAFGVAAVCACLGAACGGTSQGVARPAAPTGQVGHIDAPNQIIGTRVEGTARELRAKGEHAVLAQEWGEAIDAFEALLAGDPAASNDPQVLYDLALAYEGMGDRDKARARYREVARRFPTDANAKNALVREVSLDAYLEDWPALGEVGDRLLGPSPGREVDVADKMLAYGARGLSRIEAGDESGASRDITDGLDLIDETGYGKTGKLPVAAAMLEFAHGELRKFRSEKISMNPPGPDFVQKLETRCQGLLDAQLAYAEAVRSVDPHWAAMSGYRVGEMYERLHHDLMLIPPTDKAKTEHDKQLFYGIMHVRYRVLLEKGLVMMQQTLSLGERSGVASAWMRRAEAAKADIEAKLEQERATIKTFPFTEEELQRALEIMKKNAQPKTAKGKPTKG
jgi:tetratricopeptide (TPR) repeat protein